MASPCKCPGSGRQCRGHGLSLIQKPSALSGYAASDASCWRSGGAHVQPGWARTRYPGNGHQRYESALDTESEDEPRALQELYELDQKPSSERFPRRKKARSKQPKKWSFLCLWDRFDWSDLASREWLLSVLGGAMGPSTTGHRGWMVPEHREAVVAKFRVPFCRLGRSILQRAALKTLKVERPKK